MRNAKHLPLWLAAIILAGACMMAAGALIALIRPGMLVSPGDQMNPAAHIYAGYLFSRNLPIGVMLVVTLLRQAHGALRTLLLLAGIVQFLDAGVDCMEARWILVPGVLVLGAAFLYGAARLNGRGKPAQLQI